MYLLKPIGNAFWNETLFEYLMQNTWERAYEKINLAQWKDSSKAIALKDLQLLEEDNPNSKISEIENDDIEN